MGYAYTAAGKLGLQIEHMKNSAKKKRVLIVEDDEIAASFIALQCKKHGFETFISQEGGGIGMHLTAGVSAVLLDLGLPDRNGLDVLREIRRRHPKLPCFVITATDTASSAVEALKSGALDYFTKPIQVERLMESLKCAVMSAQDSSRAQSPASSGYPWKSAEMRKLQRLAGKAAKSSSPVLIVGESGVGKQELASTLHQSSTRRERPFITYNVTDEPTQKIEMDLFGLERGAVTDMHLRRRGKMEAASTGTLFINDVEQLPPSVQRRILEVLETGTFSKLGSEVRQRVDFNLVFGSSVDLAEVAGSIGFNPELLFRICAITLRIPPVRERKEDIPMLCEQIITQICLANHCRRPEIAAQAMERLGAYSWPGNLVEMKSALEHAVSVSESGVIDAADLPEKLRGPEEPDYNTVIRNIGGATINELERLSLVEALEFCNGNRRKVAQRLGVSLRTVYNLMDRYGIGRDRASAE